MEHMDIFPHESWVLLRILLLFGDTSNEHKYDHDLVSLCLMRAMMSDWKHEKTADDKASRAGENIEYDHDSEFEFDDGDDWLVIENTKKNADDNDTRAGDRDDKNI